MHTTTFPSLVISIVLYALLCFLQWIFGGNPILMFAYGIMLVTLFSLSRVPVSSVGGMILGILIFLILPRSDMMFVYVAILLGGLLTYFFFTFFPKENLPENLQLFSPEKTKISTGIAVGVGIFYGLVLLGIFFTANFVISGMIKDSLGLLLLIFGIIFASFFALALLSPYPMSMLRGIGCVALGYLAGFIIVSLTGFALIYSILGVIGVPILFLCGVGMYRKHQQKRPKNIIS